MPGENRTLPREERMAPPTEIIARDITLPPSLADEILERTAKLTQFHGRILRCRVTVTGPGRHHLRGRCGVKLVLAIPGRDAVISRQGDEDLLQAVRGAFKAAERKLEDHVRKTRGYVKHHEAPTQARVSKVFPERGYGFLEDPSGREIYFHQNAVLFPGFGSLEPGMEVRFTEGMGEEGPQATSVTLTGKGGA